MAGVVNPSMPVWMAHDEATGKVGWASLNEGSAPCCALAPTAPKCSSG